MPVVPLDCAIHFLTPKVLTWPWRLDPSSPRDPSCSGTTEQRTELEIPVSLGIFQSTASRESEQIREVLPLRRPALALNLPDADTRIQAAPQALLHSRRRTPRRENRG